MRRNAQANYDQMADAVAATLPNTIDDMNVATQFVAARATAAEQAASAADAAASAATQSAGQAQQQVVLASEQAALAASNGAEQVQLAEQQAARSELAAEQAQLMASAAGAAAGLPALEGNAGRLLGVNADGSGVEYREQYPAMANKGGRSLVVKPDGEGVMFADPTPVADVLITARDPGLDYLRADGSIYLKAAHPALAAKVGTVGGAVGLQWAAMGGGPAAIDGLATDHKGVWVAARNRTIWRSADDGVTWTQQDVFVSASLPKVVTDEKGNWVVAANSTYAAFSTDNGVTWTVRTINAHNNLRGLATDKQGTWLLSSYSSGFAMDRLHKSTDGGSTWTDIASGRPVFLCNAGGVAWLAGSSTAGSIARSLNGTSWSEVVTGTGQSITAAVASRTTPGVVVVVCSSGKAARSEDYGATWAAIDLKLGATSVQEVEAGLDGVMLASTGSGCARSVDDGKTWTFTGAWTVTNIVRLSDSGIGIKGSTPERSVPSYPYDPATQFAVPKVAVPVGMRAYIRARADQ